MIQRAVDMKPPVAMAPPGQGSAASASRILWPDAARGIGMSAVAVGHAPGGLIDTPRGAMSAHLRGRFTAIHVRRYFLLLVFQDSAIHAAGVSVGSGFDGMSAALAGMVSVRALAFLVTGPLDPRLLLTLCILAAMIAPTIVHDVARRRTATRALGLG